MTERLWAPWRLAYIEHADEAGGCVFCDKPAEAKDEENLVLHRGATAFVIMNRFPYSNGHMMVAPYRHTANLADLEEAEMLEMFELVRDGTEWLRRAFSPQGFNIGANLGRAAGAGIEGHLHIHIVPRWVGDVNYMAVIGDTRVIPEALADTYRRLRSAISSAGGEG